MKSVMSHQFSQVPGVDIPRSSFDRTHGHKTTFQAGFLVPIYWDITLPGDTFNMSMTAFGRLATPLKPLMDNMFMESFFFAVPIRLIWDNFQKSMGEQANPADSIDYVTPKMTNNSYTTESFHDYLGLPVQGDTVDPFGSIHHSLVHRAYNLIYNEWFRDQNLQNSVVVDKDDGPDAPGDYVLLRRGKRHDYFTSALPWPQKGTAVSLPLGTTAPVVTNSANPTFSDIAGGFSNRGLTVQATNPLYLAGAAVGSTLSLKFGNATGLQADLSTATAATINQLRQAFQIQRMYERDARGGTRYTEIIRSHFGVSSDDARLQRPEYLGGGSTPVNINPVAQSGGAGAIITTPQGNLAAFGTVSAHNHGFTKSFTEHCIVLGLVCVRADLTYQYGMNRMFSISTKFDWYWPSFSHIGEQTILNKEIYTQGTAGGAADDAVFGYQERYAEYRYKPSLVTGQFRSDYVLSLDVWHLAQDFASLPTLNSTFIVENPPVDRVIAVTGEPHFIFDSFLQLRCARPMPLYGVPGMIDHF